MHIGRGEIAALGQPFRLRSTTAREQHAVLVVAGQSDPDQRVTGRGRTIGRRSPRRPPAGPGTQHPLPRWRAAAAARRAGPGHHGSPAHAGHFDSCCGCQAGDHGAKPRPADGQPQFTLKGGRFGTSRLRSWTMKRCWALAPISTCIPGCVHPLIGCVCRTTRRSIRPQPAAAG